MKDNQENTTGYGFGTFQGVFTPSILTIIGVVMYLRFGWMLGNVGFLPSLLIVTMGSAITFLTGLSISALATNMRMKGGGAYFILSRSLGLEAGAALGVPLALSQSISVSFYVAGFSEALVGAHVPYLSELDPRVIGLGTLTILATVATINANIALKSQYFIMAAIVLSLVSLFCGGTPADLAALRPETPPETIGFWPVFAVFFPAVTGILSGVGMSGDLKNPGRSIPIGTIAAVLVGYAVYMSVPIFLHVVVPDADILRSDTMILSKCARWPWMILMGVWAATLSSAVGSFLCAPRVLQALSRDSLLPGFIGRGYGKSDDPRVASVLCFALAATGVWLGDINIIAPILTLFMLSTYGLLNLSAACEEMMSNPSWRPKFRVRAEVSFIGFAGCLAAMFMVSPGWTFIAMAVEAGIYYLVKRRELNARWGDMRAGLRLALVGILFRKLYHKRHKARNWRPNLLVLQELPVQNVRLIGLAREMSGEHGLATLASVLKESPQTTVDEREIVDSILRTARKMDFHCGVKVLTVEDPWRGMAELVRSYGFGPIVPNTVMMGLPKDGHREPFSAFVKLICRCKKNLVLADGPEQIPETGYIDIWWRGHGPNAAFMLALAFLMQRSPSWRKHPLRMNMIVRQRTPEEAETTFRDFMEHVRLSAETRVVVAEDVPFVETIAANSKDSAVALIGLRLPTENEAPAAFGDYVLALRDGLVTVPYTVFSLAAEDVDFNGIFD